MAASTQAQEPVSPYVGEEAREVKALSDAQIADLQAGKGMGYAMAAELNHYPGPLHALQLADQLKLDAEVIAQVQAVYDAMAAEAILLGEELIEAERALDLAFASRAIDEARLAELTAQSAALEGRLRAVHLAAHLAVTRMLTPEQIHAYDSLRGYGSGDMQEHDPAAHQGH